MNSQLVTHDTAGLPLRWMDERGMVHAVEGGVLVPADENTFRLWMRCTLGEIANHGDIWSGPSTLTCRSCCTIERQDRHLSGYAHAVYVN
jgi:hypothetical protein